MNNDDRLTGMTDSEFPYPENETSRYGNVTSWEQQAVDEIVIKEMDNIYHDKIALSMGLCPVCYTELSEENNPIDAELIETVYYCPHCGYESDPRYE